jgi:hypothetical protein
MKYILPFLLLTALTLGQSVSAGDVTIKTSQSEYVFLVGEDARIPFTLESSFARTNVGTLEYTLTRKQSEAGFSFSQSSTQSQSFPISPGKSQNTISLSSQEPVEYEVILSLHFRDDGTDFSANLPPLKVFFVEDAKSQNQSDKQGESPLSSTTSKKSQNQQKQLPDPFEEMEQQMNEMRQQNQQMVQQVLSQGMTGSPSYQSDPQNAAQSLQNNQMNAQTSALQQQLAQEVAEKQKIQEELSDNIQDDPLLLKMIRTLSQAGYEQNQLQVSADDMESGNLSGAFENQDGHEVKIQGYIAKSLLNQVEITW